MLDGFLPVVCQLSPISTLVAHSMRVEFRGPKHPCLNMELSSKLVLEAPPIAIRFPSAWCCCLGRVLPYARHRFRCGPAARPSCRGERPGPAPAPTSLQVGMHPRGRGGARPRAGRPSAAAVAAAEAKRSTAQQTLPWGRSGSSTPPVARPPPSTGKGVSIGGSSNLQGGADGDLVATEGGGDAAIESGAPPPDVAPIGGGRQGGALGTFGGVVSRGARGGRAGGDAHPCVAGRGTHTARQADGAGSRVAAAGGGLCVRDGADLLGGVATRAGVCGGDGGGDGGRHVPSTVPFSVFENVVLGNGSGDNTTGDASRGRTAQLAATKAADELAAVNVLDMLEEDSLSSDTGTSDEEEAREGHAGGGGDRRGGSGFGSSTADRRSVGGGYSGDTDASSSEDDADDGDNVEHPQGHPQRRRGGGGTSRRPRRGGGPVGIILKYLLGVRTNVLMKPGFSTKATEPIIRAPSPVRLGLPALPANFCLPDLYVFLPFNVDPSFLVRCPKCGSNDCKNKTWSGFRAVVELDRTNYAVTRVYKCKRTGCGHTFRAWTKKLLDITPVHVRHLFPVILTHRLAVSQEIFDLMRALSDTTSGTHSLANLLREFHTRRYHRNMLAFISYYKATRPLPAPPRNEVTSGTPATDGPGGSARPRTSTVHAPAAAESATLRQTSLNGLVGADRIDDANTAKHPPVFPAFSDPAGYGGTKISRNFLRQLYTREMAKLEPRMRQRISLVPAKFLSGDHSFKIIKHIFTFGGRHMFEAAYSLVNENSQIIALVLCQSKSLEEIQEMLVGVARRAVALGLSKNYLTLFFTDNPVAEQQFLHSTLPSLVRDTSFSGVDISIPVLPLLAFPAGHRVKYLKTAADVKSFMPFFLEAVKAVHGKHAIGLDTEWNVTGDRCLQVLQVSCETMTLVIHIGTMGKKADLSDLEAMLVDKSILKVGRAISIDAKKLNHERGIVTSSVLDLAHLARDVKLIPKATVSLMALCETFLGRSLDKSASLRLTDWAAPLDEAKQQYAALDAYASLRVFRAIVDAGVPVVLPDAVIPGMAVLVYDGSGTRMVAEGNVVDPQPEKMGNFKVGAKDRVVVKVTNARMPAFVLPFHRAGSPKTLRELIIEARESGRSASLLVQRCQLHDASHPHAKIGDGTSEGTMVPGVGEGEGTYDARADLVIDHAELSRVLSFGGGARGAAKGGLVDGAGFDSGSDDARNSTGSSRAADDGSTGLFDRRAGSGDAGTTNSGACGGRGNGVGGGGGQAATNAAREDCMWERSGVKGDMFHAMDRMLRVIPKGHGALGLFSRTLSHAMMLFNKTDAEKARKVAATKFPNMSWGDVLLRQADWVSKHVRRFVPKPSVLVPRLEAVIEEFQDCVDADTQQRLFSPVAKLAAKSVLDMARKGFLSDPPGISMYVLRKFDRDNLPVWLCCRGTNSNEGGVHQKLVRNFLSMQGASMELVSFVMLEWVQRHNIRAENNNCQDAVFLGHYDTWLMDDIVAIERDVYDTPVACPKWVRADDFDAGDVFVGVMSMPADKVEQCGLPTGALREQSLPVIKALSQQKRWLAKTLGSVFPLLPVHTIADIYLFHEVMRRLHMELDRRPTPTEVAKAINSSTTGRWVQLALASPVVGGRRKVSRQPSVFHKSVSHVEAYLKDYERSNNVVKTVGILAPLTKRAAIVEKKAAYEAFGEVADTLQPVVSSASLVPPVSAPPLCASTPSSPQMTPDGQPSSTPHSTPSRAPMGSLAITETMAVVGQEAAARPPPPSALAPSPIQGGPLSLPPDARRDAPAAILPVVSTAAGGYVPFWRPVNAFGHGQSLAQGGFFLTPAPWLVGAAATPATGVTASTSPSWPTISSEAAQTAEYVPVPRKGRALRRCQFSDCDDSNCRGGLNRSLCRKRNPLLPPATVTAARGRTPSTKTVSGAGSSAAAEGGDKDEQVPPSSRKRRRQI